MAHEVGTRKLKPQPFVAIRALTTPPKIPPVLAELLGQVRDYLGEVGGRQDGPPFARFYDFDEERVDLEVGVTVKKPVEGRDHLAAGELPGGRAAWTVHVGSYDSIQEAHDAVGDWVLATERDVSGAPWERYLVDPVEEEDPRRWRTEVIWPLR